MPLLAVAITGNLTDQTVTEGSAVTFTCHAIGEPTIPMISWYFNDIPVNESDKYDISTDKLNNTTIGSNLTVKSVKSSDMGTYTCYAANEKSSDKTSGVLLVSGMTIYYNKVI